MKDRYTGPSATSLVAAGVIVILINLVIYAALILGVLFAIRWVFFS